MGWYYTSGATKAQIIEELTASRSDGIRRWETLHRTVRGNVLWTVEEITGGISPKRLIGCYLLASNKGDWGYKPMEEAVGPCYYSCPLKYLDMVPIANNNWRLRVYAYHEDLKAKRQAKKAQAEGHKHEHNANRCLDDEGRCVYTGK